MSNPTPKSKTHWFWAWIRMITVPKVLPESRGIVWDNLFIIQASSVKAAVSKAKRIGKSESGDCCGTLRLDGKPGIQKFVGILDMGLIHDVLEDGCEILFRESRMSVAKAKSRIESDAKLLSKLNHEISPRLQRPARAPKK